MLTKNLVLFLDTLRYNSEKPFYTSDTSEIEIMLNSTKHSGLCWVTLFFV